MTKVCVQRLAIGLCLLVLVLNFTLPAKGGLTPQAEQKGKRQLTSADCNFLTDSNILANPREHIRNLSEATELATAHMDSRSVSAASIPRRNYIDEEIFGKMARDSINSAVLTSDEEFLRRVTLDLTGRIPTPDQVRKFLADTSSDRRDRLINSLIGSQEFIDRWTMWMGDLLKNTAFPSNVSRGLDGRNTFYRTIRQAIEENMPYNQFVSMLLTSTGNNIINGAANYMVSAVTPMGPPQDTFDTAVVQTGTRFLGINTFDCLLCHDGRGHTVYNLWATETKRSQAWEMSAFFSRVEIIREQGIPGIIVEESKTREYMLGTSSGNRTARDPADYGSVSVKPRYIFTGETPTPGESYRTALARFLTSDRQFARATVNFLWEEFFGLGIVSPSQGFDMARLDPKNPPPPPWTIQPSHPELLERLTDEFIANQYDLQHIMRLITQSNAYQLSSRYSVDWKETYTTYFARKLVRRLDAEELHDAIAQATGQLGNYRVSGLQNNIRWAMQLPDTVEPLSYYRQPLDEESQIARNFLNTFQRGNRDEIPRGSSPSIQQALTLMNNPFVTSRVRSSVINGALARLLNNISDNRVLVEEIFLITLSRKPSSDELEQALAALKSDRTEGAEDLMWALINKIDFLYNY
ncbi:MAG: DUF1553 domain-containing protein [Acidobacteriota bacterium]